MIDLERIDDLCQRLALGTMATQLDHVAEEAVRKEWSYGEFFERLLHFQPSQCPRVGVSIGYGFLWR
jgi:hypothetical protein